MERIREYFLHVRRTIHQKNYVENLVRASNCLNTTASLSDRKPRAIGDFLETEVPDNVEARTRLRTLQR